MWASSRDRGSRRAQHLGRALTLGLAVLVAVACRRSPAQDTLRIGAPYELITLDPHAEDRVSSEALLSNLYEPLVDMDAEMKVRASLAASWESPDPLTWVFHLRPSVTFHSGAPLRAADVVYSLKRVLARPDLEMRNYLVDVAEVREIDRLTVEVRTAHPTKILLNKLRFIAIVPEGKDESVLRASADGTGPYSLAAWKQGESVRLERNERYWAGLPAIPEAEFVLGQGPEEAIQGMVAGEYQLIQCDSKKVEAAVKRAPRYTVLRRDNLFVKYMTFDLARDATPFSGVRPNPFKNVRVRRAIDEAIDRHRLVRELSNYAVPATQPVPRSVFGFNPAIPETVHDRDRARALMKEAGLERGFHAVVHARRMLREAAMLVKEDLAPIGIDVEVRVLPDAEFFDLLGRRGATIWMNRFGCLTGEAAEFLNNVMHSRDRDRLFGTLNYGGYANPELDRAIEHSAGIEKTEQRRDALQQILARVMEEKLVVPLYNDQDVYAIDRAYSWQPRSDSHIRVVEIELRP